MLLVPVRSTLLFDPFPSRHWIGATLKIADAHELWASSSWPTSIDPLSRTTVKKIKAMPREGLGYFNLGLVY